MVVHHADGLHVCIDNVNRADADKRNKRCVRNRRGAIAGGDVA